MAKKDNTIFWVIGAIIIAALVINSQTPKEEGMIGLTPHYYRDGVEVFPGNKLFSMINGIDYNQISFNVLITNRGNIPIKDLQISDAYPQAFEDALSSSIIDLDVGQAIVFDSILMDTAQFEPISPVNFWVEVSGADEHSQINYDETYSGDIAFIGEGNPSVPIGNWPDKGLDLAWDFGI